MLEDQLNQPEKTKAVKSFLMENKTKLAVGGSLGVLAIALITWFINKNINRSTSAWSGLTNKEYKQLKKFLESVNQDSSADSTAYLIETMESLKKLIKQYQKSKTSTDIKESVIGLIDEIISQIEAITQSGVLANQQIDHELLIKFKEAILAAKASFTNG
jgi:Zn-dependent M32 family carboxypeptidase